MSDTPARLFVLGSFVVACCATVPRLPRVGESVSALGFTVEPGGKGFNVAAGARRLGGDVDGLMAVGDDMMGQLAEPAFAKSGLAASLLRRYAGATGAGVGLIQTGGDNIIAVFSGANARLSAADVRAVSDRIETAAMVLAQFEIPDPPIAEAFAIARKAGRLTLLNPSPFRPPPRDILADTSILVVNESEAEALAASFGLPYDDCGLPPPRGGPSALAGALHALGLHILIVTLGARGVIAYPRNRPSVRQPAFLVDAIDTVGAGDAFIAAFATSYVEDASLSLALRRGAGGGALTASRTGTFEVFPTRADLDCLLSGYQA